MLPVVTRRPPCLSRRGGHPAFARCLVSAAQGGRALAGCSSPDPPLAQRVRIRPARSSSEDRVTVHFVNRASKTLTAKGKVGDSLLDVVRENNLDIDGSGACEGTLACSTCHLIFEEHILEKLEAVTDENGMLNLARRLTDLDWAAKSI